MSHDSSVSPVLPYDVTVGGNTFAKGVPLSTLILAAQHWHRAAFPDGYTLTAEQKAANLAKLQGLGKPATSERDEFFDGGWCWMAHPSRNDGNAIPVKMETVDGVRFYKPLDPEGATDFEWDERDDEWRMVQGPLAESDAAFDLYCAKVAGGHLASLVDELRAEIATLKGTLASRETRE